MFLVSLTKQCAVACSPFLRVNGISPGSTLPSIRQSQEDFNQQAKLTPLEKAVSINDIIHAVDFLIKCPSITGEIITLDSGQNFDWRTKNFLECKE
jgi:enoyl-[acyl-carrier-protein] reductase (NADH)